LTKKHFLDHVIKGLIEILFYSKYDKTGVFLRYRRENEKNKKTKIDYFLCRKHPKGLQAP
jgi:hypothetical protein